MGDVIPVGSGSPPSYYASLAADAGSWQTIRRKVTDSADIGTAAVDITDAPATGKRQIAQDIVVSTDTAGKVAIQMETSGNVLAGAYMEVNTTVAFTLRTYLRADAVDKKLQVKHSVAGANGLVTCHWHEE